MNQSFTINECFYIRNGSLEYLKWDLFAFTAIASEQKMKRMCRGITSNENNFECEKLEMHQRVEKINTNRD